MRKTLVALSIISTILATSGIAQAYENHYTSWREQTCRFKRNNSWSTSEVRDTIRCGARQFNVSESTALRVAACESGYNERASNGGRYLGVFQHAKTYWSGRVAEYNRAMPESWEVARSVYNARSNVLVSMRMARSGWGPWSCY